MTTRVGDNVTVTSNGTWTNSPTSYAYQWQRGTYITDGSFTDISGETGNSLQITAAELGYRIRVKVTASNATGPSASATASTYSYSSVRVSPELVAGTGGLSGSTNGPNLSARFGELRDITVDADGNLYAADYGDYTIRKVSVDGIVSVIAGTSGASGTSDGIGAAARFAGPTSIEYNSFSNTLFVNDNGTIREVTLDGTVTTVRVRLAVSAVASSATSRTITIPVVPFFGSRVDVDLDSADYGPKFDGTYTVSANSATTFAYTVTGQSYTLANTATTGTVTGTLGSSFTSYANNMIVDPVNGDVLIARTNNGQAYSQSHVYKISRISGSLFSITKAISSTGWTLVGLQRVDADRLAIVDGSYFSGYVYNTSTSTYSAGQTWSPSGGIPYFPTYAADGYLYGLRSKYLARNSLPTASEAFSGVIAGGATDWNGGNLQTTESSTAAYGEFIYVSDKWAIYRVNVGTAATKPGAPSISSTVVGDSQVTVNVTAPLGGGVPTRYDITATPDGATCRITLPATSCVVSGLSNATEYGFVATATNAAGTSNGSIAAIDTPNVAPGVPGKPRAAAGDAQATVTVVPPLTGGGPATYLVTASPGGATCTVVVPSLACDVLGLSNATAYTFSATATNSAGTSTSSSASDVVTPQGAPGVPGKPTAVAGDGEATVTIVAPGSGGTVDSYLVTSSPGAFTCTVTSPATSCPITGLTNATAYTFWSTATNTSGTSAASVSSDAVTPTLAAPGIPGRPAALAGDGQASVTIVAPGSGGTPATYLVTATPGGANCTVTSPATSCTVLGLNNGTSYTFASTATNTSGTSAASTSSVAITPVVAAPGIPGQPVAVAGDGRAVVTIAASGSGGAPETYSVIASPGGSTCTVTVPDASCVVRSLSNGTAYTFTARATNASGTSASSSASSSITPALAAPGVPGQPTVLSGDGRVTVTITPAASGGAPDTYAVIASPGGASCTVTVPDTECDVTGLTNSTSYTFAVTASNSAGTSSASPSSSSVQPVVAAPGRPSQPTVLAGDGRATVVVSPSSGGTPESFTVTATPGGATCSIKVPATSCVVSGLANSTAYTFAVTATNNSGTSASSVASAAATPVGAAATAGGSVSINAGAAYATATSVKLTLVLPSGATAVKISNDGGFAGAKAIAASTSLDHELLASATAVSRTVYVVFLDASGSAIGQIYTDDIVLDTSQPSLTAGVVIAGPIATISPSFSDDSGIEAWYVTTDPSKPGTALESTVASRAISASIGQKLYVRVVDKAGNASQWLEVNVGTASVDGDRLNSVDDTATLRASSGLIVLTDGSSMEFTKSGQLKIRLRTGYIGYASGSVSAKYVVAGKSATYKCSVEKFKVGKVNKRASKAVNGWFPRSFWSPKKPCDLPKDLTEAMKSNSIAFKGKLKFTRLWPTTGKAINPETKESIKPIIRRLVINVGNSLN